MHSKAQAKVRHLVFSRVSDCLYLSLNTSVAEAAGNQNAVAVLQKVIYGIGSYLLGINEFYVNISAVEKACVAK